MCCANSMRLLKILPALILLSCLTDKNVERKIYIEAIGWQFPLTYGTNFKDSSFDSKGKIVEEIPINGPSLRLFAIKDSSFGTLSAYVRKNTLKSSDWKAWHDEDTKLYFEQLGQLPQMQILETKYYATTVDNLSFLVQYARYMRKDQLYTVYVYHHFGRIKEIELDISFEYNKKLIGDKYMNIIHNSKFGD